MLKTHRLTHETTEELGKPFVCTFDNCKYRATQKAILSSHVQVHHTPGRAKDVQCPLCPSEFYAQRHMKCHVKEDQFKCDLCDYSAYYSSSVHSHKKAVHFKLVKYECTANSCNYSATPPLIL